MESCTFCLLFPRSGLQPGDIIIKINGMEINTSGDVYELAKTADELNVHFWRDGRKYAVIIIPESVAED